MKQLILILFLMLSVGGFSRDIKVRPNPSAGNYLITIKSMENCEYRMTVFNQYNQRITNTKGLIEESEVNFSLNLNDFGSGDYLLRIIIDRETYYVKITNQ